MAVGTGGSSIILASFGIFPTWACCAELTHDDAIGRACAATDGDLKRGCDTGSAGATAESIPQDTGGTPNYAVGADCRAGRACAAAASTLGKGTLPNSPTCAA